MSGVLHTPIVGKGNVHFWRRTLQILAFLFCPFRVVRWFAALADAGSTGVQTFTVPAADAAKMYAFLTTFSVRKWTTRHYMGFNHKFFTDAEKTLVN